MATHSFQSEGGRRKARTVYFSRLWLKTAVFFFDVTTDSGSLFLQMVVEGDGLISYLNGSERDHY